MQTCANPNKHGKNTWTGRRVDGHMGRWKHRPTGRHTYRQTNRLTSLQPLKKAWSEIGSLRNERSRFDLKPFGGSFVIFTPEQCTTPLNHLYTYMRTPVHLYVMCAHVCVHLYTCMSCVHVYICQWRIQGFVLFWTNPVTTPVTSQNHHFICLSVQLPQHGKKVVLVCN